MISIWTKTVLSTGGESTAIFHLLSTNEIPNLPYDIPNFAVLYILLPAALPYDIPNSEVLYNVLLTSKQIFVIPRKMEQHLFLNLRGALSKSAFKIAVWNVEQGLLMFQFLPK